MPDEIEQLEAKRCSAMIDGDLAVLDRLFDDRLVWTHSSGKVDSKESLIGQIANGSIRYLTIKRNDVVTRVFGSAAVVTGTIEMSAIAGGTSRRIANRFCAVWSSDSDGLPRLVNWLSARTD